MSSFGSLSNNFDLRRAPIKNVEKTLESDRLQSFYAPLDDLFDM